MELTGPGPAGVQRTKPAASTGGTYESASFRGGARRWTGLKPSIRRITSLASLQSSASKPACCSHKIREPVSDGCVGQLQTPSVPEPVPLRLGGLVQKGLNDASMYAMHQTAHDSRNTKTPVRALPQPLCTGLDAQAMVFGGDIISRVD